VNDKQSRNELLRLIQRRSVLSAFIASLAAIAAPTFALRSDRRIDVRQLAGHELSNLLDGPGHIARLGKIYRHQTPNEDSINVLTERLLPSTSLSLPTDLTAFLAERVLQDFDRGNTIQIMGWVLSRTEARQCAIYSLLYS